MLAHLGYFDFFLSLYFFSSLFCSLYWDSFYHLVSHFYSLSLLKFFFCLLTCNSFFDFFFFFFFHLIEALQVGFYDFVILEEGYDIMCDDEQRTSLRDYYPEYSDSADMPENNHVALVAPRVESKMS